MSALFKKKKKKKKSNALSIADGESEIVAGDRESASQPGLDLFPQILQFPPAFPPAPAA